MLWAHPTTCSAPIKSSAPDPGGLAPLGARRLPHHRRRPWGCEGTWFPTWAPDPSALTAVATFRHHRAFSRSSQASRHRGRPWGETRRPVGQEVRLVPRAGRLGAKGQCQGPRGLAHEGREDTGRRLWPVPSQRCWLLMWEGEGRDSDS